MKIVSWNVNGLRAAMSKNFAEFVETVRPDVLCLQETKVPREVADSLEIPFKRKISLKNFSLSPALSEQFKGSRGRARLAFAPSLRFPRSLSTGASPFFTSTENSSFPSFNGTLQHSIFTLSPLKAALTKSSFNLYSAALQLKPAQRRLKQTSADTCRISFLMYIFP